MCVCVSGISFKASCVHECVSAASAFVHLVECRVDWYFVYIHHVVTRSVMCEEIVLHVFYVM